MEGFVAVQECSECPSLVQVKAIYAAVLQRAMWDLQSAPRHVQREAYAWFHGKEGEGLHISFVDIVTTLELPERFYAYLGNLLHAHAHAKKAA